MKERRRHSPSWDIPAKANRLLNIILVVMLLILLRLWHLSVIQHEDRLEEARRPQRKIIVERAERATIRDRFNLPLAINRVQYNAAISYAQIKEIPLFVWQKALDGKRVKRYLRKEHVAELSKILGNELSMDAERIEDLIHAKASLLGHIPFVLKEDISEKEYFRLKMLEREWLGVLAERVPKRFYPHGSVASDIIGYMGLISRSKYDAIIGEMQKLHDYLKERESGSFDTPLPAGYASHAEAMARLRELQERAYTINDYVGKTGIEGLFDAHLRGFRGKKTFYSDIRGNFLRELPGSRTPLSGQRFLLTISSELQEYAERLLSTSEELRDGRSYRVDVATHSQVPVKQPWMKGGAIVAMDPNTGEILALASYPRLNLNDFIRSGDPEEAQEKAGNIRRWLESESYMAELWDEQRSLQRERFSLSKGKFFEESQRLTWDKYLEMILPEHHPVVECLNEFGRLSKAVYVQQALKALLELTEQENMATAFATLYDPAKNQSLTSLKSFLDPFFSSLNVYDRLLLADLYRLAVNEEKFSEELLQAVGKQSLTQYREATAAFLAVQKVVKMWVQDLFHDLGFVPWKEENQKGFLQRAREKERRLKTHPRPYIDYLDRMEGEMFKEFWQENGWELLSCFFTGKKEEGNPSLDSYKEPLLVWVKELEEGAHASLPWAKAYHSLKEVLDPLPSSQLLPYLQTMRGYQELNRPLFGRYPSLRQQGGKQLEKHLAAAFYPKEGFGYARSQSFRQVAPQGSIFKIVTAYAALSHLGQTGKGDNIHNPLTIIDDLHRSTTSSTWNVGYTLDGRPIPQLYKGGRLPRSLHPHIGKVDLATALEVSSNPYFSLLAEEMLEDPEDLLEAARLFSYGKKTGIDLPGEAAGQLPSDLSVNRTGLYAMAIGQHSMTNTPLQTAVMLSAVANGGKILKPKIVNFIAGKEAIRGNDALLNKENFAYKDSLSLIGIDFPLFTAAEEEQKKNQVTYCPTQIQREVYLPANIRLTLLEAMRRVITGERGTGKPSSVRSFGNFREALRDYYDLQHQIVGKTSTAEKIERIDLDGEKGSALISHIWFAGIAFDGTKIIDEVPHPNYDKPELVVVVYLRYGDYGKEAAPLAAKMVKKWREIKANNENP